jgi:hypothetical protein
MILSNNFLRRMHKLADESLMAIDAEKNKERIAELLTELKAVIVDKKKELLKEKK